MSQNRPTKHNSVPEPGRFVFQRFGKARHLKVRSLSDLRKAFHLDEAHWAASNAPVNTFNADSVLLELLDADGDGRIRSADLKEAIRWLFEHLELDKLSGKATDALNLTAIRGDSTDGERILAAANKLVTHQKQSIQSSVDLATVREIRKQVEEGGLDKPGMVLEEAAPDEATRALIIDILETVGGEPHRDGKAAVTLPKLERFLAEAHQYIDWWVQIDMDEDFAENPIMPLGKGTIHAFNLFARLKNKLDHYFALCNLVHLAPATSKHLKPKEALFESLDLSQPAAVNEFLEQLPIAWPGEDCRLSFESKLNPRFAEDLQALRNVVLNPILATDVDEISQDDWEAVKQALGPHEAWVGARPELSVTKLLPRRAQRYLIEPTIVEGLRRLIDESHRASFDLENVKLLEKLILFRRDLVRFANSFVSFPDLYHSNARALFEMGTLIVDGRHFTFSVRVRDRERHATFSQTSNIFVLYAEISHADGQKLYDVAVPVTAGTRGNLQENKWGIFIDANGEEHHARIFKLIENPISLFAAIMAPFMRLGNLILEQFGKKATAAERDLQQLTTQGLSSGQAPAVPKAAGAPSGTLLASWLAGGGIAVAALGSSVAFITDTLSDNQKLGQFAMGLLIAVCAVLLPIVVSAFFKLRQRDLSCILEGSGWGINGRMALNRALACTFTRTPGFRSSKRGARNGEL